MQDPEVTKRHRGDAGRLNLVQWQERERMAQREAAERVERFKAEMIADLGGNPSVSDRTLIESAGVSILVIAMAEIQLKLVPSRLKRKKGLSAAIAAHQNSLLRCLRMLNASRRTKRPVPRTVEELIERSRIEVSS